jgi:hypothetical protein
MLLAEKSAEYPELFRAVAIHPADWAASSTIPATVPPIGLLRRPHLRKRSAQAPAIAARSSAVADLPHADECTLANGPSSGGRNPEAGPFARQETARVTG